MNNKFLHGEIEKWFDEISTKSKFRLSDTNEKQLLSAKKSDHAFNIFSSSNGIRLWRHKFWRMLLNCKKHQI